MSDADTQELITNLDLIRIVNYCELAVVALLVYDYLLTLAGEVEFMWKRKLSGATVVFALNRYITLFGRIVLPVTTLWWPNQTDKTCAAPVILVIIFTVIAYFVAAVFSALRVYAVWDRNWKLLLLVMVVAIVVPVTNMYHYILSVPAAEPFPFYGCAENINMTNAQFTRLSYVTHSSAIATDLLVVVLTWLKTYQIKRIAAGLHLKPLLSTLLLRDGTLYFVVLLILNIVDLIIDTSDAVLNPLPIFIDAFTCILISRFMLNLREVARPRYGPGDEEELTTIALSQFTTIRIARPDFVGNLGAPLTHGTDFSPTSTEVGTVVDDMASVVVPEKVGPLWAGLLHEGSSSSDAMEDTTHEGSV